jgi:hypothetical protein
VLIIKVAAALLLLLGSGLIFRALVALDAPTLRPRSLARRLASGPAAEEEPAESLRRAA